MRFILKVVLFPVIVVLELLKAVLSFLHMMASWLSWVLCVIFVICCVYSYMVEHDTAAAVRELIAAFVLSPCGLPAVAEWIIDGVDSISYTLRCL